MSTVRTILIRASVAGRPRSVNIRHGGGVGLSSYEQVSGLPDYPPSFPPASHDHDSAYQKLPAASFTQMPAGQVYNVTAADAGRVLAPGGLGVSIALPQPASSVARMEFYVVTVLEDISVAPPGLFTTAVFGAQTLLIPVDTVARIWNMGGLWFAEIHGRALHNGLISGALAIANGVTMDANSKANLHAALRLKTAQNIAILGL